MPSVKPTARRPRRSTETVRALILQAARELFAERGYGGATTREIAQRADVNEVLLFRYFTSKAKLFEQAVFEPFQGFMQEFSQQHPPSKNMPEQLEAGAREFVEGLYQVFFENRRLMMALIAASLYEPEVSASMADITAVRDYFTTAEDFVRRDGMEAPIGIDTGVRLSFGLVAATVLFDDWIFAGAKGKRSHKRIVDDVSAFILGGFQGKTALPGNKAAPKVRTKKPALKANSLKTKPLKAKHPKTRAP